MNQWEANHHRHRLLLHYFDVDLRIQREMIVIMRNEDALLKVYVKIWLILEDVVVVV